MFSKIISFITAVMAFLASLFGIGGSKTVIPEDMISYNTDNTAVVITLKENPSTGNKWDPDIADQNIAELSADRYYHTADKNIAGAPGTRVLTFAGKTAGTTKLILTYERPWESGKEKPVRVIELQLTVNSDNTIEAVLISDTQNY